MTTQTTSSNPSFIHTLTGLLMATVCSLSMMFGVGCVGGGPVGPPQDPVAACMSACGDTGVSPEHWICATNGQRYMDACRLDCSGAAPAEDPATCEASDEPIDDEPTEAEINACLNACPLTGIAPEYWTCASDGNRYMDSCEIGCMGLEVADDAVCEDQPIDDEPTEAEISACLNACPLTGIAPEYWTCASDGNRYMDSCEIGCMGLEVADDASCEG